jgi:hypothetical protein
MESTEVACLSVHFNDQLCEQVTYFDWNILIWMVLNICANVAWAEVACRVYAVGLLAWSITLAV